MNRLVEFGLLGSVEAHVDGRPVDLGHARQRCVLAALLVDVDRVVPADRLVERVWTDPASLRRARDTLYGYVSRLRRALADVEGVDITRRSGGYVLGVGRAVVDLHRFRDLVGRARAADRDDRTADLFDRALALWRGDALSGLDTPWTNELRDTLDHERFAAELDRVDARLGCGRHAELSGELARLAQAHPLDERLAGQLMLALYRCGRPADALHHYRQLTQRLCEELGCDPGPRLRELHQRILTTDPALDLPVAAEPAVVLRAAPARRLVGRTAELALAQRAIDAAVAGRTGVLEVVGEPGIGKTRLLDEVGERARRRGLTVLAGRCAELDQAPYGVLVDALDPHLAAPVDLPDPSLDLLGTVFPTLAERRSGPKPLEAERYWFHRSLQGLLKALGGSGGLVLGLDDLHWSDPATVEFLDHLVRHPPRTPLLLVLAHRPRQSPPRLVASLARAEKAGHFTRVELGPLSPAESAELCGVAARGWEFGQLYAAAEGNPFYLEALARSSRTSSARPVRWTSCRGRCGPRCRRSWRGCHPPRGPRPGRPPCSVTPSTWSWPRPCPGSAYRGPCQPSTSSRSATSYGRWASPGGSGSAIRWCVRRCTRGWARDGGSRLTPGPPRAWRHAALPWPPGPRTSSARPAWGTRTRPGCWCVPPVRS
ncbi:BTAD domain-containing putative transcriptional regulator [Streptomyces crystallinus]|uniref:BTAD domain-containing putative transcriptional regulator n=1 Tax=Streptomyces crystallinus TaxID=68191 RepID=UPI0031D22547